MPTIIQCGFRAVDLAIFRKRSLNKGRKLLHSFHVSDVKELINDDFNDIVGVVLRETPGAQSTRAKANLYKVQIKVDSSRIIQDTSCNCKGGQGYCKHAAAVCLYVNAESTCSKTDQPMIWNRPPNVQLEKYKKGATVEEMFRSSTKSREDVFRYEDVQNITTNHLSKNYIMSYILKKEIQCSNEKERNLREATQKEALSRSLLEALYIMQDKSYMATSILQSVLLENGNIKLSKIAVHQDNEYFRENVVVDEHQWMQIALKSSGQSETSTWHKERSIRITASTRAHRIKTRQQNFDILAQNFLKDTYKHYSFPAMRYGLKMEKPARLKFQDMTNCVIHEVGLIICSKQPYLACSPDGIIDAGNGYELLEIKCPYSCENRAIVNMEKKLVSVPYLEFDSQGKLQLKKSDRYYTQVQVAMHVLAIDVCHFFVYSSRDEVQLVVRKDQDFLSDLIPKIEHFYFKYFIPVLQGNSNI